MAKVLVYSKEVCPYCDRAKSLLASKGVEFEEIVMDTSSDDFVKLAQKTGMRTVPQIFINDKLVGGYTELNELEVKGELDQWLAD